MRPAAGRPSTPTAPAPRSTYDADGRLVRQVLPTGEVACDRPRRLRPGRRPLRPGPRGGALPLRRRRPGGRVRPTPGSAAASSATTPPASWSRSSTATAASPATTTTPTAARRDHRPARPHHPPRVRRHEPLRRRDRPAGPHHPRGLRRRRPAGLAGGPQRDAGSRGPTTRPAGVVSTAVDGRTVSTIERDVRGRSVTLRRPHPGRRSRGRPPATGGTAATSWCRRSRDGRDRVVDLRRRRPPYRR